MTITTTLGALVQAEPALGRVTAVKFDQPGGAKVRYHLVKLARLVAVETKHFYDERNALVEQHGEGTPKVVARTAPAWATFAAACEALAAVPVTIPWGPLTEAMAEPYADISAADLVGLGPLYTDEVP
jgi:hypothetical protein